MKRKFLTVLLALVASLCLCFALASCGGSSGNGGNGGNNGNSEINGNGGSGDTEQNPQTPEEGEQKPEHVHTYTVDNVCSICGDQWEYTEGLEYELDKRTDSYIVSGIGTANGDVVIPYAQNGKFVTSIGERAFGDCSRLTSITIPDSVTSIGGSAFVNCSGLEKVIISDLSAWCKIDFYIDLYSYNSSTSNPLYYAHHLYLGEEEIKDLVIPNEITEIKNYAFSGCSGLTSITIPSSITSIGSSAFEGCSGLTSVTIPDNVTSIGEEAFRDCSGLESVTIGNGVTSIGWGAFKNCSGLEKVIISDLSAWCKIDFDNSDANPLSYAHHLYLGEEEIKELVIPNDVTEIKYCAFV